MILTIIAVGIIAYLFFSKVDLQRQLSSENYKAKRFDEIAIEKVNLVTANDALLKQKNELQVQLEEANQRNELVVSQKKSSETRLGQISEHLVPFLENCKHDPKNLHFLGSPIDYISFDLDEGTITFIEIKSGNSKPSKRQKLIKNIIKTGRVFYEEIRINDKGVKSKKSENLD